MGGVRNQEQEAEGIRDVKLIDDGWSSTRVSNVAQRDTASRRPCLPAPMEPKDGKLPRG